MAAVRQAAAPTVVQGNDVQAVEQLPLVLVDPLHVDVEHGRQVDFDPVLLLQVLGELQLVVLQKRKRHVRSDERKRGRGRESAESQRGPVRARGVPCRRNVVTRCTNNSVMLLQQK